MDNHHSIAFQSSLATDEVDVQLSDCQRLIQSLTCQDCLDDVFVGNFLFVFLRAMPWSLASRSRWSLVSQGPSRVPWKNARYAKQILESYFGEEDIMKILYDLWQEK